MNIVQWNTIFVVVFAALHAIAVVIVRYAKTDMPWEQSMEFVMFPNLTYSVTTILFQATMMAAIIGMQGDAHDTGGTVPDVLQAILVLIIFPLGLICGS